MTFTVKYRGADGAPVSEAVEAANRADCLAQMKARGVAVLGVKEGNFAGKPRKSRDSRDSRDSRNSRDSRKSRKTITSTIIAVVAVAAILGAGIWWMMGRDKAQPSPEPDLPKKTALAKEVKPAAAPKPEQPKKRVPQTREERLAWFEKKYGTNIPENLKTTVYFLKHPPTTTYRPLPRPEDIFKHQSEKTIAAVLLHKPGAFVMRRTVYDESFDMDFRKSLEEPIIAKDDDDEATKELKAAVNDVKAELAERMRAGEKPSKIMTDTMDTAYELGKYSRNMETMLHEMSDNPANTDKDIEDFVNAANKLLKEKGAGEMEMPNFFRRQLRLKMLARKAKKQNETKEKGKEQ